MNDIGVVFCEYWNIGKKFYYVLKYEDIYNVIIFIVNYVVEVGML